MNISERLKVLALYIFVGLLAYIPFHIFLSTWFGSSFHMLSVAKAVKDAVMIIGFGAALIASLKHKWFTRLLKDKLVWLILIYGLLTLLLALIKPTDQGAESLAVVYNTRFLVFFLYGLLLSKLFDWPTLKRRSLMAVMIAGFIVLVFGVFQYILLPDNALTHVGYSRANGVLPAFFIDDKPDLERIMSTLRDPNSLGSYIIIIGTLALAYLLKTKDKNLKQVSGGLLGLSIICLFLTFSRSAWLGFVLSGFFLLTLKTKPQKETGKSKDQLLIISALACLLTFSGLYALRNSYWVKNITFHADQSTVQETPNQLRLRFWRESAGSIVKNPVGTGPGTAGLTSIHNTVQGTEIPENYYLQIGREVGIIGLALFISILVIVGQRLYKLGLKSTLGQGLFIAFIGLALTNFLVHIWSSEAVAYTFWGLAGIALNRPRK